MWVVDSLKIVVTPFNTNLELADTVAVTRYTEDTLGFEPAERENSIGEKGQDYRDLEMWVRALLETDDSIQGFTKC